jgi:nucleotide-binding universal stress UspA family protein
MLHAFWNKHRFPGVQMSIKSILVPVTGQRQGPAAIQAAFSLAKRFEAHVEGLHVLPDPGAAVPYVSEGMSGDMIQQICDATEKEGLARAKRAETLFNQVLSAQGDTAGVTTSWKVLQGQEDLVIAAQSRNADVTFVSQPGGDLGEEYLTVLEGVLFQSGRPSIVVPHAVQGDFGTSAAIAWNGSSQASRAVISSMPLLKRAKKIAVMQAGTSHENVPSSDDVVGYLGLHGLAGEAVAVSTEGEKIAEALLRAAMNTGADLLVMGAFTHSRWREMILGGVTRYMLENAKIPVLMAH